MHKNINKITLTLTTLCLTGGILAACGKEQSTSENAASSNSSSNIQSQQSKQSTQSKTNQSNNNNKQNKTENIKLTTPQLGTLVCLFKRPDWFKSYMTGDTQKDPILFYSDTPDKDGFNYITGNGDPTSFIYFKRDNNNVVIKFVDPDVTPICNAPMETETIQLQRLLNDYYKTPAQQQEVNNYANQLPPESSYNAKMNSMEKSNNNDNDDSNDSQQSSNNSQNNNNEDQNSINSNQDSQQNNDTNDND